MHVEIEWDDKYSVSIDKMDKQHQKLIGIINELVSAMSKGKGKDIVEAILENLLEYTKTHFRDEEEYFETYNYPGKAAQKEAHQKFISKIEQFSNDYQDGRIGLSVDILQFLSKWLITHISGMDREYSAFLNEKGVN